MMREHQTLKQWCLLHGLPCDGGLGPAGGLVRAAARQRGLAVERVPRPDNGRTINSYPVFLLDEFADQIRNKVSQ